MGRMSEQRSTTQREAIRDALSEASGPLLPEEILDAARETCPTLGQATVYRALRVYDIDGCVSSPASLGSNLPSGFELEGHEVVLFGVCAECG